MSPMYDTQNSMNFTIVQIVKYFLLDVQNELKIMRDLGGMILI